MAKNLGHNFIYNHADTETKLPFLTQITGLVLTHKFKQPYLDSYNGSRSPVDYIRTYRAQMALATNADELRCLAFWSTLKGQTAQ